MIEIDDAIPRSNVKFYRNLERAIFLKKTPTAEACKEFWRSVCFHNLVLKPMNNIEKRRSLNDYLEGWKALLIMSKVLKPNYCIFAGTDSQKVDAFIVALKSLDFKHKSVIRPVKLGRSKGRAFLVESATDPSFYIVFIRHPSAFFNWQLWGKFITQHIPSVPAIVA